MAKLDFPSSPTTNQKHPQPAIPGLPVYTWDGEKWGSIASTYIPGTAPFESAMTYSGMQVNGSMEVAQMSAVIGIAANTAGHIIDSWYLETAGTQNMLAQQNPGAPPGFTQALQVGSDTIRNPSPAGTNYAVFSNRLEGQRIARLAWGTASAQPVTLSFWVWSTKTGLHSGAIRTAAANPSYVFSFTVTTVLTWEYKTISIPGCTIGTWSKDNSVGLIISFALMSGGTYSTTPGVWTTGNFIAATGQVNLVDAAGSYLMITGVIFLSGTQAPTAAQSPNIMRRYDDELTTCRRYFRWNSPTSGQFDGRSGNLVMATEVFSPGMRATPTLVFFNGGSSVTDPNFAIYNASAVTIYPAAWTEGVHYYLTLTATAQVYQVAMIAPYVFKIDARL